LGTARVERERWELRDPSRPGRERIERFVEQTLEAWMELKVNREKTRTVRLNEPGAALNFLGYTFRYDRDRYGMNRRYLNLTPSEKSLQQTRGKLREMTDAGKCFMPIRRMIDQINQTLRGWKAYFRQGYPAHAYREVDGYTLRRLRNHLGRRSQRAYKKPEGVTWWDHLQGLGWKPLQTKPVRA
jgi:RNA-directed DNA polymerase